VSAAPAAAGNGPRPLCYHPAMRNRMALALIAAVLAGTAAAAEMPLRIAANPDPLRAASLPFDPVVAAAPAAGEWRFQIAAAYANLWQGTWQTAAIHAELNRWREPIGSDELRELESRYPDSEMYRIDLEAWRTDLVLQRGFANGLALTVQIPWLDVGRPHWDAVGEWWHAHLGLPNADRDLFPRGETFLYAKGRDGIIEERRQLAGSGLGDIAVSLGVRLGELGGASHRLVASVEAPTGDAGTLLGSGGWDLGVRYFADWRWRTGALLVGAGYTRLDPAGALLGRERADTWHAYAGCEQALGRGWRAAASFTLESSPLADFTSTALGSPAAFLRFGLAHDLGSASWLALDMGQDWYNVGVSPDYAFRLTFGVGARPLPGG